MNNNSYRATLEKAASAYVQSILSGYMGTKTKTLDSNQAITELSERLIERFIDTLPEDFKPLADSIEQDFIAWCEQNGAVIAQIDRVTVSRTITNNGNSITIGVTADRYPDMDLIATRAWLDLAIVKMLPEAITNARIANQEIPYNQPKTTTAHNVNNQTLIETLEVDGVSLSATLKGKPIIRFFGGQWQKFGVPLYLDSDKAKGLYLVMEAEGFKLNEHHAWKGTAKVIMEGGKPLKVSDFELTDG